MNAVLDDFLVGAMLLASIGYAVYKLGPRTLRARILAALGRSAAAGKSQGACGGCDNCGSESTESPSSAAAQSSAEIKIPVAKIGRRA
jgi:sugar phosphate permease